MVMFEGDLLIESDLKTKRARIFLLTFSARNPILEQDAFKESLKR